MTALHNGPDLGQLALQDRRIGRELAAAERERILAEQQIVRQDAEAERRLRMQEGKLQIAAQRDQVKADRAERRRQQREAEREARRARKQARRAELAAWTQRRVEYVRDNAASVYCGLVYGLAVSGAVYGQVDAARAHGLPTPVGVIAAIAIEGTGLAMALTAQQQRLRGERALAARSLIWVCTAAAVAINAIGHGAEPVKAIGLSVLSAIGIIVYEVRSGAKHRKALRDLGMIPDPPERFGWRRWMTYPGQTFAAWRVDVRDRLSPGAKALIEQADARRAEKRRRIEARRAEQQRLAAAAEERQRQQKVVAEVADRARQAAKEATKKGQAGPALAALVQLAHTGTPAPLLALPSWAHVEAEAARTELRSVRAALAEAEAHTVAAERRAEAEAVARVKAEAEARAALDRAEAEAVARRTAEAEAVAAVRRAEAEASVAALARQAEAEARAGFDRAVAEAEAARDALRVETARASRMQGQFDAELAESRRRLQAAEAVSGQARRELTEAQQALHRAEALAEAAAQEAAGLRTALAQAAAESGRRPRRGTSTTPAEPAEPLLFDGKPVPHVDRTSPETVLKVLQARKDNPDALQKDLATATGVSDRTVRAVLAAIPTDGKH
ncbi:DUF2637 domain-containing protein [Micromonospora sp. KC721]|uniref:DUF2637 domain-containing protein n=1 Tax=Micromonospora sp. KC721 TaxID=2530380 RepID=UPI00104FF329|nr:DUF2637 domain-containing protein [Micromonospora sp. KC721]TDB80170.1 DUF2637 domain-containing protein [Micromonospora sp. KC721]